MPPDQAKCALIELLSRFVNQFKLDTTDLLVTDRSSTAVCRPFPPIWPCSAMSPLFRIPEELNRNLPQVLAKVVQRVNE